MVLLGHACHKMWQKSIWSLVQKYYNEGYISGLMYIQYPLEDTGMIFLKPTILQMPQSPPDFPCGQAHGRLLQTPIEKKITVIPCLMCPKRSKVQWVALLPGALSRSFKPVS